MSDKEKSEMLEKHYLEYIKACSDSTNSWSAQECENIYEKFGDKYDEVLQGHFNYQDPGLTSNMVAKWGTAEGIEASKTFKPFDKENSRILDFGCGTGLVGKELAKEGFKKMDGLDGASNMLKICKDLNLYQELELMMLGMNDGSFPEKYHNTYDIIVSCGCFGKGHFTPFVFDDIWTALKHEGLVFFTIRDMTFFEDESSGHKAKCEQMEKEGKLKFIHREEFVKHSNV